MKRGIVLLIEGHQDTRDVYGGALRRRGYEVLEAGTAAEGIRLARESKPDVVLLDMALPDLDGWQAAERFEHDPDTAGVPVLAITVHARDSHQGRDVLAGRDVLLEKRCSPEELCDEVGRALSGLGSGAIVGRRRLAPARLLAEAGLTASLADRLRALLEEIESAEAGRRAAEDRREESEAQRRVDEEIRYAAESQRLGSDETRMDDEDVRVREESGRFTSEMGRRNAEDARARSELDRQASFVFRERAVRDALEEVRGQMAVLQELQETLARLVRREEER